MALFMRKAGILAKLETTAGTDSTPTGAANAMLVSNLSINPLEGSEVERDFNRPYFGASGVIRVENYVTCSFEVELAGSGAAGTAPAWGPLVQACGFSETVSAGTSVVYAPVSSAFKSLSIYYNVDGVQHIMLMSRGTFTIDLSAKSIPKLKFNFTGLLGTISDAAVPSSVFTAFQVPAAVSTANTTGLSLHAFTAAVYQSLTIDMGVQVVHRQLVGGESTLITGRKVTGAISMEAVTVATKDFWTSAKNAATGVFAVQHGQTAGNIIEIDAPKMMLTTPKYSDSDGIAMLDMNMHFIPSAATGNDEITISAR